MRGWLAKVFLTPLVVYLALLSAEAVLCSRPSARLAEILRLRAAGANAHPAFTAQYFLGERPDVTFVPLGGIANATTVLCQEDGPIVRYQADRHGFRNPDAIWNEPVWDLAVIGDSYVQGYCESDGAIFVDHLRRSHPRTANLGSYGNGPLANLATLLEYAARHHPKKVLWVYVPNDLRIDLPMERENPTLMNYLLGKTQDLSRRQNEIDRFLGEESARMQGRRERPFSVKTWLGLRSLKTVARQSLLRLRRNEPEDDGFPTDDQSIDSNDYQFFETVLAQARGAVGSWGGELIVVGIRDAGSFRPGRRLPVTAHFGRLREITERLGLKMHEFAPQSSNPFLEYNAVSSYYGHVNSLGHRDLAAQISQLLAPAAM